MSNTSLRPFKSNPNAVTINASNLQTGILYKHRNLLKNVKSWHEFTVSNTNGLGRNEVLRTILDHVHPLDLIPIYFVKDQISNNSYFMARNCEQAIQKLCNDCLVVDHPLNKKLKTRNHPPFHITIRLNYASTQDVKVDVQKNVSAVLNKRYSLLTKCLDLSKFDEDKDLSEFCPLSQPKIMYFVLHIAKGLAVEELKLSHNGIKILDPLDLFIGMKLTNIDLSHNELPSFDSLSPLKHFSLQDLKLTGNPLCDCEEFDYIRQVRGVCPTVNIVDGIPIHIDGFLTTKKYFFCDYGSTDLVNQFLEHFFTVYDSPDRRQLAGLYHLNAMFSLNCVFLNNQLSSGSAFLKIYSSISRNLIRAADLSKTSEFLFQGRDKIVEILTQKLPATAHDPYSFTADLIFKTETCAVIVVTGVYHEKPNSLLDKERFLGFNRSFALQINGDVCQITNDQLHVYNGLTYQELHSFSQPIPRNKTINQVFLPEPKMESDCEDLVTTLSQLSNMKAEWSRKCLEECSFNLKASLELFVDLYKGDKLPGRAFLDSGATDGETNSESENPVPIPQKTSPVRNAPAQTRPTVAPPRPANVVRHQNPVIQHPNSLPSNPPSYPTPMHQPPYQPIMDYPQQPVMENYNPMPMMHGNPHMMSNNVYYHQ